MIPIPLQLLVVDSVPLLLEGLTALLNSRREFEAVSARDAWHLPPGCNSPPVDIAIVDLASKTHDGWRDVRRIQETLPGVRVVVMDEVVRDHQLRRAMRQNLAGFLVKFDPLSNLAETILEIRKSDFVLSTSVLQCGYSKRRGEEPTRGTAPGLHLLTQREVDVLRQIGDGLMIRDIAQKLRISECTLDNHKTRILRKLQMHRVVDLVRFAIGTGLTKVDASNCLPPSPGSNGDATDRQRSGSAR